LSDNAVVRIEPNLRDGTRSDSRESERPTGMARLPLWTAFGSRRPSGKTAIADTCRANRDWQVQLKVRPVSQSHLVGPHPTTVDSRET
jgi:hypothetical protein